MPPVDTVRMGPSGLPSEEFWNAEAREVGASVLVSRRLDRRRTALSLDAPARVDLTVRDTLPVIGAWCCTFAEEETLRLHDSLVVTAVRIETHECVAASAFYRKPMGEPAVPSTEAPPIGFTAESYGFDARAQLPAMSWEPGTWVITTLLHTHASNRVHVQLELGDVDARFDHAPRAVSPAPREDRRFPRYEADANFSPALPSGAGIAMQAQRVVLAAPDAWCLLHGSFRLPVLPRDHVTDTTRRENGVVGITLVAVGDGLSEPWVYELGAAVYQALEGTEAEPIPGWFSVDLFALPGFPREPQTLHLWAFAGEVIAGPVTVALVSEAMLAPL